MNEDQIISQAIQILEKRLTVKGDAFTSPEDARQFCILQLAELEHEVFGVMFLDTRHRLLAFEAMFRGTIDGASVHPREVAKRALQVNAAAVIFTHNHPSGVAEPSRADIQITDRLVKALSLLDVRVLDHILVGGTDTASFAERGLL